MEFTLVHAYKCSHFALSINLIPLCLLPKPHTPPSLLPPTGCGGPAESCHGEAHRRLHCSERTELTQSCRLHAAHRGRQ